jgi:hypothetical protein
VAHSTPQIETSDGGLVARKTLDPVEPAFLELANEMLARGITVYVGTGLSLGAPTRIPKSSELVALIAPALRLQLGIQPIGSAGQRSLEDVADEAQANGSLRAMKDILATVPELRRNAPNSGHFGLVTLLREGLVSVLSVNWDMCFEQAATALDFRLDATTEVTDRRGTNWRLKLNKIHGCVSVPGTLRVSSDEIAAPDSWAVAETELALQSQSVVFIGLGTVPDSLADKLRPVLATSPASVHVVAPSMSSSWTGLLTGGAGKFHPMDGGAFSDELVRALATIALTAVITRAQAISGQPGRASWAASGDRVVEALGEVPSVPLLNWIRQGARGIDPGTGAVLDARLVAALAALAGLADGRDVRVEERSKTVFVRIDSAYVELAIWPGGDSSRILADEEARTDALRASGVLPNPTAPIVHLAAGHDGPMPSVLLVPNLIGGMAGGLVAGPSGGNHYWIPIESYLQSTAGVPTWPTI